MSFPNSNTYYMKYRIYCNKPLQLVMNFNIFSCTMLYYMLCTWCLIDYVKYSCINGQVFALLFGVAVD